MTGSKSSSARGIIAALSLLFLALACAEFLGEVSIQGRDTRVETILPGDAGASPVRVCEPGVTRCDGRVLQLCPDDGSGWATLQACATPELCESSELSTVSGCLTPHCAEEQMSCEGSVLRLCNAARTGWEVFDTCESAAHCDAGKRQCLPAPCNPGDRRCNVGNLERCRDDRLDWEPLDECVTNELCEATLAPSEGQDGSLAGEAPAQPEVASTLEGPTECRQPACVPREVKCEGVRLEVCNEGQTGWLLAEECGTPILCDASITYTGLRGSPRCVRPTCAAGEHRCTETGVLELCNEGRDGYQPIEQCIGAPFCNSVAANNGLPGCEDAPCEAGVQQCNGPQIQACRQDRTGFDALGAPCETRGLCNDDDPTLASCAPPVCQRGPFSTNEFICQGATLQRCNDQHTGYDVLNTCVTPGLCNAALGFNGCVTPPCAAGETRCNGDFVQVCNAQRTGFENVERCQPGTCDSSSRSCADPCVLGSARCNAQGQLEECRDRLVGRQITALCGSPQLCDAQNRTCRAPPAGCTADGVRRCRVQGGNTVLEVCSDGRSRFSVLDTCGPAEFCDVNDVSCDTCDQTSQPSCDGNILVTCAANGQSARRQACASGCQEVTNGPDRCRTCVPGNVSCDGTQLVVCRQRGGEEFLDREPCDTAALCQETLIDCNADGTGQACRCQDGVCDPGDRDCEGSQPVACNADQTDFVNAGASCVLEENCNPAPVGACFPCGNGDVRCGADGVMEGCRSDRSGFADIPGVRVGDVRCLTDNSGTFSQQCNGARLGEDRCESGLCVEGSGCAECNPATFESECAAGNVAARTVCVGGRIELRACPTASGCLEATCTGNGSCDTRSAPAGKRPCDRADGSPGVCDGIARTPSCVECVSAGDCDDGVACTVDSCALSGACQHVPSNALCTDDGAFCNGTPVCSATGCAPGAAPDCSDTNECTDASCDEANDRCVAAPLSVGACTQANGAAGVCSAGVCGPPVICSAGAARCEGASFQVCNAAGTAFVEQDQCASAALCGAAGCAAPCDGQACEFGCDPATNDCARCTPAQCQPAPDTCSTAVCSADGLSCTRTTQCEGRLCVGGECRQCVIASDCPEGQACTGNACVAACDVAECGVAGCNAAGTACNACDPQLHCADLVVGQCEQAACAPDGLSCVAVPIVCAAGQICGEAGCAAPPDEAEPAPASPIEDLLDEIFG